MLVHNTYVIYTKYPPKVIIARLVMQLQAPDLIKP